MYSQQPGMQPVGAYSPVDTHHTTLLAHPGGNVFQTVPTSAAHLAEQMELGGAKIEETLVRLNCKHHTLFFSASWGVVCASLFGFIQSFVNLELSKLVNCIFLILFGLIMSVLDIPGNPRWAFRYRQLVRKYVKLLTRLMGKSMCFLYLGSIVSVTLWPSTRGTKGGAALMMTAFCISFFVIGVAIIGLFIAFRKSLRLERLRKILQATYSGNSPEAYRKYAITDPSHGMQLEEFNRLCADHTHGHLHFEVGDLAIIFNALDDHQKSAINEREFSEWMAGPMTYL